MKLKHIKRLMFFAFIGLLSQACAHEGPYRGRVIEEDGGKPIAGAVVVGNWTTMSINVGGGSTSCVDARETVTDEKGEFEIPSRDLGLFGGSGNLNVVIYKVGFKPVGYGLWESLNYDGGLTRKKVEWEGDRAIIPLVAVPKSRLRYEGSPPQISCGRKDGKPLEAWYWVNEKFDRAIGVKP